MARVQITEVRWTCSHCDIKKSSVFSVDRGNLTGKQYSAELARATERTIREVIRPNYPEPPHNLTIKIYRSMKEVKINQGCGNCGHTYNAHVPGGCTALMCNCKKFRRKA